MSKKFLRRGIILTEVSIIKDKKEIPTSASKKTSRKLTHEIFSRGIKNRCNLYYNSPLTSRNARPVIIEPHTSRVEIGEFVNSRENSISFAEPRKKPKKKFFFIPTAGNPRKVNLKKTVKPFKTTNKEVECVDVTQTIIRNSISPNEIGTIELKCALDEPLEENSSEETPKFKCEEESSKVTLKLKECISREELTKSSFTSAFNSIQNLQAVNATESNKLLAKVNFRRRSRILKASTKKAQCQKATIIKEPIHIHRRIKVPPVTVKINKQPKQEINSSNIPWSKDTEDACNLTFGED